MKLVWSFTVVFGGFFPVSYFTGLGELCAASEHAHATAIGLGIYLAFVTALMATLWERAESR